MVSTDFTHRVYIIFNSYNNPGKIGMFTPYFIDKDIERQVKGCVSVHLANNTSSSDSKALILAQGELCILMFSFHIT